MFEFWDFAIGIGFGIGFGIGLGMGLGMGIGIGFGMGIGIGIAIFAIGCYILVYNLIGFLCIMYRSNFSLITYYTPTAAKES